MVEPCYIILFLVLALLVLVLARTKYFNKYYEEIKKIIIEVDNKYIGIHNQSSEKLAIALDLALDSIPIWEGLPNWLTRMILTALIEWALRKYKKECGLDGK